MISSIVDVDVWYMVFDDLILLHVSDTNWASFVYDVGIKFPFSVIVLRAQCQKPESASFVIIQVLYRQLKQLKQKPGYAEHAYIKPLCYMQLFI